MTWPTINPLTPASTDRVKFGDDEIRGTKQLIIDGLGAISNYSNAGSQPALKTTVWNTAGRPTGGNLVDKVTGFNSDLGCDEYYDGSVWKIKNPGLSSWNVAGRPATPYTGQYGYNTDLAVQERWNGSAWVRVSGGRRGDIKLWSGAVSDIETGWVLADGTLRTHPEGGNYTPPDLRAKFIVGAGQDGGTYTPGIDGAGSGYYAPGATGGYDKHTQTQNEMPSHAHSYTYYPGSNAWAVGGSGCGAPVGSTTGYIGGGAAMEMRPPYYALCFLYKI